MVVALFALSLVMIVGGIASVVQGFPFVRLESGLAMVIGGATAASAGAILLGLAAVVMRLQRLEGVLRAERLGGTAADVPPRESLSPIAPPAPMLPVAPAAAGLAGLSAGAAALTAERREPDADAPAPSVDPSDRFAPAVQSDAEPPLPDLLPPGETIAPPPEPARTEPEEAAQPEPVAAEDDLFTSAEESDRRDGDAPEQPALRSSLGEDAKPDEQPAADAAVPAVSEDATPEERQVVGTYASGGNTYVMFSDGSIEAETPRGRFTFGSLEELKSFVEAGGEIDARGAA